ncbi:MAG TPA: DUF2844 domain-containing protein [Steroidobacteraceae bacterium]|nr:DUF2844 domain-containing protein [Steroidobacteraceae bacterium]
MAVRSMLCVAAVALLWSGGASAHLDGDVASVQADAAALYGLTHATALLSYDVQQIDTAAGLTVREFVARDGTVFALSWTGPVLPDMRQLLGQHFGDYTAALAALDQPGLRRSVRIALPGLVVESGGHLRAYSGRAYLPARVPDGVSLSELR